jgi:hypothetical protein
LRSADLDTDSAGFLGWDWRFCDLDIGHVGKLSFGRLKKREKWWALSAIDSFNIDCCLEAIRRGDGFGGCGTAR